MLFNSAQFIGFFLPAVLLLYYFASKFIGRTAAIGALVLSAFIFYSEWNWTHLFVLIPSIIFNYLMAAFIIDSRASGRVDRSKMGLVVAIVVNLGVLGFFKYGNFAIDSFNYILATDVEHYKADLPLGISFFTFTQITYLVDGYRGLAERVRPLRYALFVTYFPHLIAGPILHHSQILPQFEKEESYRFNLAVFIDGLSLFGIGLAKKVLIADPLGQFASYGFNGAGSTDISFFAAWGTVLSYTFQLYFDFSGYSDMAVGLARMMRIDLPINFFSPYKATSIIDFWRRWHITLSRFLRDYVYIPLGGNRRGEPRRYLNLFLTMTIGGLWHGAGLTFLLWGVAHGLMLTINHAFVSLRGKKVGAALATWPVRSLSWLLTFAGVVFAWVLFRAADMGAALSIYAGMLGKNGFYLPASITNLSPALQKLFGTQGNVPLLADQTLLGLFTMAVLIAVAFGLSLFARNPYEMSPRGRLVRVCIMMPFLIQAVFFARHPSEFLYFQF